MKRSLLLLPFLLPSCVGLSGFQQNYSLAYVDAQGREVKAGFTLIPMGGSLMAPVLLPNTKGLSK